MPDRSASRGADGRQRRRRSARCDGAAGDRQRDGCSGRRTVKVAPRPTPALAAVDRAAVQLDQLAHDRQARGRARRACAPRSTRPGGSARTRAAGTRRAMPTPSSLTASSTSRFAAPRRERTWPPGGVNLIAFESRFQTTCCSRLAIAEHLAGVVGDRWRSRIARASAAGLSAETTVSNTAAIDTGWMSSRSLPEVMRLTSSRSSIRRACARALRSIVAAALATSTAPALRPAEQVGPAEDGVERRAQLVRQRGQELVLHAARPLGLDARLALGREQRLALVLELLLAADVERDAVEAGRLARRSSR